MKSRTRVAPYSTSLIVIMTARLTGANWDRLSAKEFSAADPDKDGTLTKRIDTSPSSSSISKRLILTTTERRTPKN